MLPNNVFSCHLSLVNTNLSLVDNLTILSSDWFRGVPAGGPLHEHAADDAVAGGELHVGHHAAGGARRGGVLSFDTDMHISVSKLPDFSSP